MWQCWCKILLPHVAQQHLSLWVVLMHTSIIFTATDPYTLAKNELSHQVFVPHLVSFFGAGLRKSLDDLLMQDHNSKARPQPRILWMCLESLLNCSIYPPDSSAVFWCQTFGENPKHLQERSSALKVYGAFSMYNLNCFPDWGNVSQHMGFI